MTSLVTNTGTSLPYRRRRCGSESTSTSSKSMPSERSWAAISSQRWQPSRLYSLAFVSEARDGHERGAFAALHLQGDHRVLVEPGEDLVELLDRFQLRVLALVHHGEQHIALANVGLGVRPHVGHHQAVIQVEAFALLGGQLAHHDAEAVRRHLGHLDAELLRLALAEYLERGLRAGTGGADDARQVARALDRLAVKAGDDVGRFHAGLVRRAALLHRVHQRAARAVEAERGGEVARHFLDHHADPASGHAALVAQLLLDVERDVDRDREGKAHEAAGAAVDLRIDADHLAAHVEQRPARVARVDRHVGLDERHEVLLRQRAPLGADDAGGDRVLEAERRADRHHPLAHLQLGRVAELHRRQPARVDLDHCDVGAAVGADHLGLELALVGEAHVDLVGAVDHVRVGEDVAVGADDEARAERARLGLLARVGLAGLLARDEAAEEFQHLFVLDAGHLRHRAAAAHRLRGADVDHRVALVVNQAREVGQLAHLRRGDGAEGGKPQGCYGFDYVHLDLPKTAIAVGDIRLHWRCAARSRLAPRPPRSPRDWRLRGYRYGLRPCLQAPGALDRCGLRAIR